VRVLAICPFEMDQDPSRVHVWSGVMFGPSANRDGHVKSHHRMADERHETSEGRDIRWQRHLMAETSDGRDI